MRSGKFGDFLKYSKIIIMVVTLFETFLIIDLKSFFHIIYIYIRSKMFSDF